MIKDAVSEAMPGGPAANAFSRRPMSRQARTAVFILWLVLLSRFTDQNVPGILLEAIRREFVFSDAQLGIIGGLAFSVVYGLFSLPFAWLADRTSKKPIIVVSLAAWSGLTALGSAATGFWSLCLSRIGVGVAEAGGTAPTFSLLSDLFPKRSRSTVLAIVSTSTPVGIFLAYLIGGWVTQLWGWRVTLLVVGLPGMVLALVAWLFLKEPARGDSLPGGEAKRGRPGFREVTSRLWKVSSYRHLIIANVFLTVGGTGSGLWIASYFIRTHGMSNGEIGTWLALIYGAGGTIGVLLGGVLADHVATRTGDARWYVRVPAYSILAVLPFSCFTYLSNSPVPALLVHIGTVVLMYMWMGPVYGTVQNLAERSYRATAAAINLLIVNVVAVGGGPLLVGYISDSTASFLGGNSLRYAILATVLVMYSWSALHFLLAGRTIKNDLDRIREEIDTTRTKGAEGSAW